MIEIVVKNDVQLEIPDLEESWAALELQTLDKAPLSQSLRDVLTLGRIDADDREFVARTPFSIARFKAETVKGLMGEAEKDVGLKNGQSSDIFFGQPIEELSPQELRQAVAADFLRLKKAITRWPQDVQSLGFLQRHFVREHVLDIHCDRPEDQYNGEAVLVFRLGGLGVGFLDPDHPGLSEKSIQRLIKSAQGKGFMPMDSGKAMAALWKMGVLKEWPVNELILMSRHTLHCSSPVPDGGRPSVFGRDFFQLSPHRDPLPLWKRIFSYGR